MSHKNHVLRYEINKRQSKKKNKNDPGNNNQDYPLKIIQPDKITINYHDADGGKQESEQKENREELRDYRVYFGYRFKGNRPGKILSRKILSHNGYVKWGKI